VKEEKEWKGFTKSVSAKVDAYYYRAISSDNYGNADLLNSIIFHVNPDKTTEFVEIMTKAIEKCDCSTIWKIKQLKHEWRYALMPAPLDGCSDEFYKELGIDIAKQALIDIFELQKSLDSL
jgi:hypothetical protein